MFELGSKNFNVPALYTAHQPNVPRTPCAPRQCIFTLWKMALCAAHAQCLAPLSQRATHQNLHTVCLQFDCVAPPHFHFGSLMYLVCKWTLGTQKWYICQGFNSWFSNINFSCCELWHFTLKLYFASLFLLDWMVWFSLVLQGWMVWNFAKVTRATPEDFWQLKNFENIHGIYCKRRNWLFFFKTEFWRKFMIKRYNDEILWWKLISNFPHVSAGIIWHFEDKICETLDLMTEMTLVWPRDHPWV